jgi:hypothetical protein
MPHIWLTYALGQPSRIERETFGLDFVNVRGGDMTRGVNGASGIEINPLAVPVRGFAERNSRSARGGDAEKEGGRSPAA